MQKKIPFEHIYFWTLVVLSMSMPLSPFMMSICQFVLLGNWLLEGNFAEKWHTIKTRKGLLIFLTIYLVHLIWLFNSSDLNYAFKDLRIKLPLLILPLIIATSKPLKEFKLNILLNCFTGAVFITTLISTAVLYQWIDKPITDRRDISLFISHIRFSLLIVLVIVIQSYRVLHSMPKLKKIHFLYLALIIWFLIFLMWLQGLTGLVVLAISVFILLIIYLRKIKYTFLKVGLTLFVCALPTFIILYLIVAVQKYYEVDQVNKSKLPLTTLNGNPYLHNTLNKSIENGHYIWLFVCDKELEKEWDKRSAYKYWGVDRKKQLLRCTLMRYLTSKGLPKDSSGIAALSDKDIKNVESGLANFLFARKGIYPRIHEVIGEFDGYFKHGYVNGASVIQRILYLKMSYEIIKENFWFGTGTGDVEQVFKNKYLGKYSYIQEPFRHRAHNQWVTFFISFGIFGFLWEIFAFFYPVFIEKKRKNFYFLAFFLIALLSFLNEDTIETQAGVTFFAYFYSLFLFGYSLDSNDKPSS
jgi:hypothetical protein